MNQQIELRYGCNPHQTPASVYTQNSDLPIQVLNGTPGYINLLDALNGWQLVRELKQALNMPAAASFKHVSPAGAATAVPMSDVLKQIHFVADVELSPLATAYARARGADRLSSFGDWAALSDVVDVPTAHLLAREVSDGVIAPGYEPDALAILQEKKQGSYRVIQIDPNYEPPAIETRDVFGVTFAQQRSQIVPTPADLTEIVTANRHLPDTARRDMIIALITLKYTQSNSVCYAYDGQVIGVGAGQQSRIHCTRLAGSKADTWFLRQHRRVLNLPFRDGIKRPERDNAIDQYLMGHLTQAEESYWLQSFNQPPIRLTADEKRDWIAQFSGVTLGSDAFFPFRDSIDRASQSGVTYVVQPGGSVRDDVVIEACDEYGMVMALTGTRLFHH
ncbi:MAG: phosphoribosylaminoimidazolecarboxamide formyltransferase [Ardenticatenaceae bacterium]|nr:phosphoribosylaminoimidazolecarboxamide formyltransferase [Ardenticatenaceae bacterium]MCB9444082.1 phosphoribosylaminoimidazolecarboxamide formyltransferase [Ardenticatenaceae bacterium]